MKDGSLNLLELSGPVQVCNGIALAFTISDIITVIFRILVTRLLKQACAFYVKLVKHNCRIFLSTMLVIGDSK